MAMNTKVELSFNNQAKLELIKHSDSAGKLAVPCAAEGFFVSRVACSPFAKLATCGSVEKDLVLLCSDCETTSNLVVEALIKYKKSGGTEPEINCPVSSLCRLMPAIALEDDNVTLTIPPDALLSKASDNKWIILTAEDINNIGTNNSLSLELLLEKITHSPSSVLEKLVENKEKLCLLLSQLESAHSRYSPKNKTNRMIAAASQHFLNNLSQASLESPYESADSEAIEEQTTTLEELLTSLTCTAAGETSSSATGKLSSFIQAHKSRSTLARERQSLDTANSKITRSDVADLSSPFSAITKNADWIIDLLNKICESDADEIALLTHAALKKLMLLISNKISKQECSPQDISLIVNAIKVLKDHLSEEMLNSSVKLSEKSGTRTVLLNAALEELSELSTERVADVTRKLPSSVQPHKLRSTLARERQLPLDIANSKITRSDVADLASPFAAVTKNANWLIDLLNKISKSGADEIALLTYAALEKLMLLIFNKISKQECSPQDISLIVNAIKVLKDHLSEEMLNYTVRLSQQSGTRIVLLKVALEELSELSSERVAEMKSLKPLLKIHNKGVSVSIEQYGSEMHLTDFDLIKLNKFGLYDWYISAPVLLIEKLLLTPVDTLRRLSGRQAMTLSMLLKKTAESTKAHITKKQMAKDAAKRLKNNLSQPALNYQGDFFDKYVFSFYSDGTVDTYLSNLLAKFEGTEAVAYSLPTNKAAEADKETDTPEGDGVTEGAADDVGATEDKDTA